MPFESRVFQLAKDTEYPEEYQDAYRLDAARGIAAVADGVTSSIFARRWAGILTEATVADTPDPNDEEAFGRWLQLRRKAWSEGIDTSSLAWHQKAKLPTGAFSTLLWVRVLPVEEDRPGAFGAHRLQGFAIGDSCLFHVRHGEVLRTFPIQKAEELEADPLVVGSVNLNRDQLLKFQALDEHCYLDDLLVLCTDAVAAWALRLAEAGDRPDWEKYWNTDEQEWREEVIRLRDRGEMRYDDATLMLLRVTQTAVEAPQPAEPPAIAEVVRPKPEEDWRQKFKSAGEQVAEGLELASDQAIRGWKKWKRKAIDKYRDTFGKHDK
ncbi:MAG: hypothetical protein ACYSWU_19880 [Planctomycetota bacterium]|jgi:hypothetical protein